MKNSFLIVTMVFYTVVAFSQEYNVAKKIHVAGNESWDYLSVDNENQHLFISHGNVVNVIDLKTDKTIATIQDTKGVHGIAIANDLNKAFISCGKDNTVSVINLTTFELIEKIAIDGQKPDAILYDKFSDQVFTFNAKSNDATVINAKTNKVIQNIPLGGKPEFAVTNGKGFFYVNIEDLSLIKTVDTKSLQVINTFSIAPGEEPSGLALDLENNRLFSVCSNKLMIISDAKTGKIIQKLPIGDGCDGVVFDVANKLVFSSNGEGTVTVVKEISKNEFKVIQTLTTQKGARTITINPATNKLYLPTANYGARPEPTTENQRPRATIIPDTFEVLVVNLNKI